MKGKIKQVHANLRIQVSFAKLQMIQPSFRLDNRLKGEVPHFRNAPLFIILFVRNFLEGLFAILAECSQFCLRSLLIEIQEEILHFAGWEGGGQGAQNCEQTFCEQTDVTQYYL